MFFLGGGTKWYKSISSWLPKLICSFFPVHTHETFVLKATSAGEVDVFINIPKAVQSLLLGVRSF